MDTNWTKRIMILILTFIFLVTSGTACESPPQEPKWGFNPRLSISEAPALGKPAKISLTFTSPNLTGLQGKQLYYVAHISLPPGVYEVVSGNLTGKGLVIAGETHTLEATIRAVRTTGSGEIYGYVAGHLSPDDTSTGSPDFDVLFITISQ